MAKAASDFRIPIVRHLIACERIDTKAGSGQYSLINIIHAIKPLPGAGYPRIQPLLCLFAHLTDGRGAIPFRFSRSQPTTNNRLTPPPRLYWIWERTH
jgi:hypothetical protein